MEGARYPKCVRKIVGRSNKGAFVYFGGRTSNSYRMFAKMSKKLSKNGFGFAYVRNLTTM